MDRRIFLCGFLVLFVLKGLNLASIDDSSEEDMSIENLYERIYLDSVQAFEPQLSETNLTAKIAVFDSNFAGDDDDEAKEVYLKLALENFSDEVLNNLQINAKMSMGKGIKKMTKNTKAIAKDLIKELKKKSVKITEKTVKAFKKAWKHVKKTCKVCFNETAERVKAIPADTVKNFRRCALGNITETMTQIGEHMDISNIPMTKDEMKTKLTECQQKPNSFQCFQQTFNDISTAMGIATSKSRSGATDAKNLLEDLSDSILQCGSVDNLIKDTLTTIKNTFLNCVAKSVLALMLDEQTTPSESSEEEDKELDEAIMEELDEETVVIS